VRTSLTMDWNGRHFWQGRNAVIRDVEDSRPYVLHIRAEHRRLRETLRRILDFFPGRAEPAAQSVPSQTQLADDLTALRDDLAHHFTEEESGGCLDEATARCPSLLPDVKAVEAQHPALLSALDRIIHQARSCEPVTKGEDLAHEFRQFAHTLQAHESAENRILGRAFGGEFDVDEVEP